MSVSQRDHNSFSYILRKLQSLQDNEHLFQHQLQKLSES